MERGFAVRRGKWKFILNCSIAQGKSIHHLDELYNLENDPWEETNLAYEQGYKDKVNELKGRIYNWLDETDYPYVDRLRSVAKKEPIR